MGLPREVMDRATEALVAGDYESLRSCYIPDVMVTTPDAGTIRGVDQLMGYYRRLSQAFPDMRYEPLRKLETGYCAIDQGENIGHHTGPLELPDGRILQPTGKEVRVRSCDVAVVENGFITRHDIYWDQMELALQLGVLEELAGRV